MPLIWHRKNFVRTSEEHRRKSDEIQLNTTQKRIIEILKEDSYLTAKDLSDKIGIAQRNIEKNIKVLKDDGRLIRCGSAKGRHWEIIG